MAVTTSLLPIDASEFTLSQARHLLSRAGFGGPPAQVQALQQMGLDKAVGLLVDYDSVDVSALPEPEYDSKLTENASPEERKICDDATKAQDQATLDRLRADFLRRQAMDRRQMASLEHWWIARMIGTPRPLEEKLTLLWHGHFATAHRTIHSSVRMLDQNRFFRKNAAGSFADLAQGIIRDPAMLRFLNNDANRRQRPNENLARELMELFTLGEGNYTEQDIKEGAPALTGYSIDDEGFVFRAMAHDGGSKTILGKTGNFKGEEFVRILLDQHACARFVATKLYRHFVADVDRPQGPTAIVVEDLANVIKQNNYQLKPALRMLFKSRHFHDSGNVGTQIRSPAHLLVGLARMLGTPARDMETHSRAMDLMGQKLFDPPSVAGWDGGTSWINTSTLFVRQNLAVYLLTGKLPSDRSWNRKAIGYDPSMLLAGLKDRSAPSVTRWLADAAMPAPATTSRLTEVCRILEAGPRPDDPDTVLSALLLITAMPEYQLC